MIVRIRGIQSTSRLSYLNHYLQDEWQVASGAPLLSDILWFTEGSKTKELRGASTLEIFRPNRRVSYNTTFFHGPRKLALDINVHPVRTKILLLIVYVCQNFNLVASLSFLCLILIYIVKITFEEFYFQLYN